MLLDTLLPKEGYTESTMGGAHDPDVPGCGMLGDSCSVSVAATSDDGSWPDLLLRFALAAGLLYT